MHLKESEVSQIVCDSLKVVNKCSKKCHRQFCAQCIVIASNICAEEDKRELAAKAEAEDIQAKEKECIRIINSICDKYHCDDCPHAGGYCDNYHTGTAPLLILTQWKDSMIQTEKELMEEQK